MASPAYLSITGTKQGLITRGAFTEDSVGNMYQEGHEDQVMIQTYSHSMTLPTDPQSGQPAGQRRHNPFIVTKDLDKSTPLLANAMASGEKLEECELRLYRTSATGTQEHYFTIKLLDAIIIIISISSGMPSARSDSPSPAMETIAFSYRAINWEHINCGTSGCDDWRKSVA